MDSLRNLFENPPSEYRAVPFWAWNCRLHPEHLKEQIHVFKEMGFGGFHIHSRIGLNTPYLSDEFMDLVAFCNECGKTIGLSTWLYDEDKWPSGFGGGLVTEEEAYRARYLLFTPKKYEEKPMVRSCPGKGRLTPNGTPRLVARYDILQKDGCCVSYRRLMPDEGSRHTEWYAYEVVSAELPWFNNAAYVDTLNPDATHRFTEVVHDAYKKALGDEFSKSIQYIFTDEPQFTRVETLADDMRPCEASVPYTIGMPDEFKKTYGYDFLDQLPDVFMENSTHLLPQVRYHVYDFIAQRFADSFAGVIGAWCERNNVNLTGHLMNEQSLEEQTMFTGDVMRSYPYFQIPGIDILADTPQYNTLKQVQSIARQEGKSDIASEIYGVTNWDYDFRGHKLQGDWQAALGITKRVPHLAWASMGGESKRDYPAPLDNHSPWHRRYPLIENHFARLNTVLKRGTPVANVAVIHPIESHWMLMGPDNRCFPARIAQEERFADLTKWLLLDLQDFDFLSEGTLPKQTVYSENGTLHVGKMAYRAVVVPPLVTIRQSTVDILNEFSRAGGTVICLGDLPPYTDAVQKPCTLTPTLRLGFDRWAISNALEPFRLVDAKDSNGLRTKNLIYQLRKEQDEQWLFIAHADYQTPSVKESYLLAPEKRATFSVVGHYAVERWNTMDSTVSLIPADHTDSHTVFTLPLYQHDSYLFRLVKDSTLPVAQSDLSSVVQSQPLPTAHTYHLEEPNSLLLDQAEWRVDGGDWQSVEEILRLDNAVRDHLTMRRRTDSFPQPWLIPEWEKDHALEMRFTVRSEIFSDSVDLAFEGDSDVRLFWNGNAVSRENSASFVDHAIHRVALGPLQKGENHLLMQIPFGVNTNLEWCYLLGDFGVRIEGRQAVIIERPGVIGFGDYATQGLPFYGGNLVYETEISTEEGELVVEIPHFAAALIDVSVDDGEFVPVFMEPYHAVLGHVTRGKHTLRLKCYGTRINQFGQVHHCNPLEKYFGPGTWRTTDTAWCYEYNLKKVGIFTAPIAHIYR